MMKNAKIFLLLNPTQYFRSSAIYICILKEKGSNFASAAALAAIAGAAAGGAAMLAKNLGLSHQAAEQEKKSGQKPKAEA